MNMRSDEIQLGDKVRDKITGFEGIVVSHTVFVAGCERVGVQSQELHEGKPVSVQMFDVPNLTILEKNAFKVPEINDGTVQLGDRVRDTVTNFKGIATSITSEITGESRVGITPEAKSDGKPAEGYLFSGTHVEKVEEKHEAPSGKRTGGDQQLPKRAF